MSVTVRTEVRLVDDSDETTLSVTRRDTADEPPWQVDCGSKVLYVSSADLAEFAGAIRELIADDVPHLGPDPWLKDDES